MITILIAITIPRSKIIFSSQPVTFHEKLNFLLYFNENLYGKRDFNMQEEMEIKYIKLFEPRYIKHAVETITQLV